MLKDAVRAAAVLTRLRAAPFLMGGALRIIFSLKVRFHAWPWVLLSGAVDVLLGLLNLNGWSEAGLRVIGLFVGIDLVFHGWSWVVLALSVRTYSAARSA